MSETVTFYCFIYLFTVYIGKTGTGELVVCLEKTDPNDFSVMKLAD